MDNVKQMAFYQMCCKLGIMLPYSVKDLLMYGGIRGGIFQNPLCLRIPFNAALLIDQEVQSRDVYKRQIWVRKVKRRT